jgi:uncharacterized protein (TIGR00299 family) protein
MARVAYLDATAGASGDMLLGALLDLGLPLDDLRGELAKLPFGGHRLEAREVKKAGLRATKLDVVVEAVHPHGHHHHGHGRGLREILDGIDKSGLDTEIKERAAQLFRRLAAAEAGVHGTSEDEVHFHEVGAVDSIVDIVGAVIGLRWLAAETIVASPLNLGGGSVLMEHGRVAVPAPATARLVAGVPVFGEGDFERLTPTGALLVTSYASAFGPLPAMRLEATGCGAGTRDSAERPNVFRILVGALEGGASERVLVLECEVDDMPPQLFSPLIERLLGRGALDAFLTPVHMKKGRPGILISVLARPESREAVEELLFSETTTLGVRRQEWQRSALERELVRVETPYGEVGVKLGRRGGRVYNAQPEYEDCLRAASQHGVALKEVFAAALVAYRGNR